MIGFLSIWLLLVIYSFTRQDLNLTFYRFLPAWLQWVGWFNRPLATLIFVILTLAIFCCYFYLLRRKIKFFWLVIIAVLGIGAYPMFSYDLFNYLFNAKMVLIYHVNPQITAAVNFPDDPMLRFMQNVTTPAPYGYGWTILSLIPGLAWFAGKFILSFWLMKAFIAAFWLGQLWILKKLVIKLFPKEPWRFWLFALNPLVLVETLINGHNDVVMMFLALLAYWYLLNHKKIRSIFLLLLSASIKYASAVLLPLYFVKRRWFPVLASLLLAAVMFTRPDQLHSWYLIWAFSFAVLAKPRWLVSLFTALTIGGLLRYAPFIYLGNWDPPVYLIRNSIWLGSLILAPFVRKVIR